MAIEWEKLEGYHEGMSDTEKLALLENQPAPEEDPDKFKGYVPKAQFDKAASEIAALKKAAKARENDNQTRNQDTAAQIEALNEKIATLTRERMTGQFTAKFVGLGFEAGAAEKAAEALADGDHDSVFSLIAANNAAVEKRVRADLLKNTPSPLAGEDNSEEAKKKAEQARLRGYFGL